jgi:pyridoxamine 5'-phosphate oxidase
VKRSNYERGSLDPASLDLDPLSQFDRWLADAVAANLYEPTAMTVATVGADGLPDARVVLLRGTSGGGFQFYTNYESKKGRDLAAHPAAALVLYWNELERQVRIRGSVSVLGREESLAYFALRPRPSQLGAWLSRQSEPAAAGSDFQAELAEIETRFAGGEVPLPLHWGGYHVAPAEIEFWQGRPNRLHDRYLYQRRETGWEIVRLYP